MRMLTNGLPRTSFLPGDSVQHSLVSHGPLRGCVRVQNVLGVKNIATGDDGGFVRCGVNTCLCRITVWKKVVHHV